MATATLSDAPDNDLIKALTSSHFDEATSEETRHAWQASAGRIMSGAHSQSLLRRYAESSADVGKLFGPELLADLIATVDHVRKLAGKDAAIALVSNINAAVFHLPDSEGFTIWLSTLRQLAERAPKHLATICVKFQSLLSKLDAIGFQRWVSTGITSTSSDPGRLALYFNLEDEASRHVIELEAGTVRLADIEKTLSSLPLGLWRKRVILRAAGFSGETTHIRTSFDETFIRVPTSFEGFQADDAERLFKAAITHIGAHIEHTGERRQPKALKPVQIALVSILEDTRAELMAARRYPGLLDLWKSFHTVPGHSRPIDEDDTNCACHVVHDSTPVTDQLLARLARALIDENFEDENPWVQKGRQMFLDAGPDWDPEDIRRVGVLLGNDLGQMRLQFNAKTYVVEPPYRDDNMGLWDFPDPSDEMAEEPEVVTASMRLEQRDEETPDIERHQQSPDTEELKTKHKPVSRDDDQGVPVCKLPEWDYLAASERPNWVTIVSHKPRTAPAHIIQGILNKHADIGARIAGLVRQSKIGQTKRLKKQHDGDRLDLDACIQHRIDTRAGKNSDIGLYETTAFSQRDLSVLVLLDVSESTKDLINGTATSVYHLERDATALLAEAMDGMGDPFAIDAFCSNGRSDLQYFHIKNFGAPYNDQSKSRLAGLRPGLSTRMGGALRYAGSSIAAQLTKRKLVLVVTDGEPSDVDVKDPNYLIEDARKAVLELAAQGIDVFAVGLVESGHSALPQIFGQRNTVHISNIESLPERLPMLYFRLVG